MLHRYKVTRLDRGRQVGGPEIVAAGVVQSAKDAEHDRFILTPEPLEQASRGEVLN